ncbi:MAG: hypothetical protein LWX02_12760 [Deltaproteobacteria bacterium]|nr:hypothetical protein [Deltaproteobacteria bacterium]MDL1988852.1 hypothetical protein [Deltaproteobacteria bacterium]
MPLDYSREEIGSFINLAEKYWKPVYESNVCGMGYWERAYFKQRLPDSDLIILDEFHNNNRGINWP